MSAPPPFTPADCDLSDFGFMPWQANRFRKSTLVANAEPEEILAALLLYGEAWHNLPAASLDNDDKALARAAGYGRAVDAWLKVKAGALRGFVLCSDGRLYHPVVAEHARAAWQRKLEQRHRTFCAAVRKHNERNPADRRAAPSFDQWETLGRPERVTSETARPAPQQGDLGLDESDADLCARPRARTRACAPPHTGANPVPKKKANETNKPSRVTNTNVTRDTPPKSRVKQHPRDRDRDRDREIHRGLIESPQTPLAETLAEELAQIAALTLSAKSRVTAIAKVQAWLDDGIDPATMRKTVKAFTAKTSTPSRSLHRFDSDIRLAHAKSPQASRPSEPPVTIDDDADPRIAAMRRDLRTRLGERAYDGWLKGSALTLNGTGLILTCPSMFIADWTQANLSAQLTEAAHEHGLGRIRITTASTRG